MTDPNKLAYNRIVASHAWLTGVRPAAEVVPGMRPNLILHAAPPATWDTMSDIMRAGMIGAALFEGLAHTPQEAAAKADRGIIEFDAAQNHDAVAGGVGSITASTPVVVVEDRSNGNRSAHALMEGLGRTLVSGIFDDTVLERLVWFRDYLGPLLDRAIGVVGGVDIRELMCEALQRGDELHNRNRAATSLFVNRIALALLDLPSDSKGYKQALQFLSDNLQFFVCAVLPAAELMLRAARNIAGCSAVTSVGANGKECGLRISGLGNRWFTAPSNIPHGVLQPGIETADVGPACGDSFLIEFAGFGASVLSAAPALTRTIGASLRDAERLVEAARTVSLGEHPYYNVPALGFRGPPVGVDARKVLATRTLPTIDITMVHREPGVGLVGMGLVNPPMQCFEDAIKALDAGIGQ
jgi:hypothetical protein